jgi:hypothetical protein
MVTSISAVVVIMFLLCVTTINVFMLIGTMSRSRSAANCCKIVTLIVDIVIILMVAAKVGGFYL